MRLASDAVLMVLQYPRLYFPMPSRESALHRSGATGLGACLWSADRSQHVFRAGVVTKRLADMDKQVLVSGSEDEAAAELKRIFAQPCLPVSGSLGALAGLRIVAAQKMKQRCIAQLDGLVGLPLFVDQQGKLDSVLFPEVFCVAEITQPDGGQPGALFAKFVFKRAHLRDMLGAEDSSVVAQKHDDGRRVRPQRAQANLVAVHIRERDSRELAAEGVAHVGHSLDCPDDCQVERSGLGGQIANLKFEILDLKFCGTLRFAMLQRCVKFKVQSQ